MKTNRKKRILEICIRSLDWAREQNYTGYNKHDGLNSTLLRMFSLNNKWLRILFIQGIMRFPLNIRPVLGVKKVRNPKGISLFVRAYLNLYRITGDESYIQEAESLLGWLLDHPAHGFQGLSWGYEYPWQDMGFYAPAGFPNRIVTYFVGKALAEAYAVSGKEKYLEAAEKAVGFILNEPKVLFEDDRMKCLSYVPLQEITVSVMDVSALCGELCSMVGRLANRRELFIHAKKLISWVADKQTDYGAWFYTHPSRDSHITHDNYHTGEIVDAIFEYQVNSGDEQFENAYRSGLDYYRENLFTPDARPRWMNDKKFPYDIHGYSQGIITFAKAGDMRMAEKIALAAIDDMWDEGNGRFFYQKKKHYTKKFTLMRWCQAWMVYALTYLLVQNKG